MNDFEKLKADKSGPIRIGVLDIETSNLEADFGYVLVACVKEVVEGNLTGKITTIRIDDPRNSDKFSDKWVIKELVKEMNSYDLLVHWYGSGFDIPFVNSRALYHNLMPPQRNFSRDLCYVARGIGKLRNNRLATWGKFLFGQTGKTSLAMAQWLRAIRGERAALNYVVDHCRKDVIETERIYKRFSPLLGKLKRK